MITSGRIVNNLSHVATISERGDSSGLSLSVINIDRFCSILIFLAELVKIFFSSVDFSKDKSLTEFAFLLLIPSSFSTSA